MAPTWHLLRTQALAACTAFAALVAPAYADRIGDPSATPADYLADAQVFFKTVACGGFANGAPGAFSGPAQVDTQVLAKHCTEMHKRFTRIATKYAGPARTFLADKQPADLPTTVVYPFGGGDLLSAIVVYPNAREITTMSLEHAGDPTRLAKLSSKQMRNELSLFRSAIEGLLELNDSTTDNMQKMERGGIPGQLAFHLTGAAAMGYEPISLKYFTFNPDGTIHYLSAAEISALAPKIAKKKKGIATDTDFSEAFSNMELTLRKIGEPSGATLVHRHISWNLADNAFRDSPLQKHLLAKGKFAAITKAASYLLWYGSFEEIRNLVAANLAWMISDATGLPPRAAKKANLQQTTYGKFVGAFLEDAQGINEETQMVEMWAKQPSRKLPFRFGYPDSEKHWHMMITQPRK